MVDEMTCVGGRVRAFEPYNLRRKPRCRSAADTAGCNISDNHKLQDTQARIRHRMRLDASAKPISARVFAVAAPQRNKSATAIRH